MSHPARNAALAALATIVSASLAAAGPGAATPAALPVEVRTAEEARALDPTSVSVRIAAGEADAIALELAKSKKLESVDARASRLSDEGLRALGGAKALVDLDASDCPSITDAGVLALAGLKKVEVLRLAGNTGVGDAALVAIAKFARLRVLDLSGCKAITDAGLKPLRDLEKIEELDLSGVHVSEKGTPHLARLRSLKRLRMNRTGIPDMSMQDIVALLDLEALEVADNSAYRFGEIGLLHVDGLRKLKHLDVSRNVMVTDDVLKSAAAIPGLEVLRAVDCKNVGDAGVAALAGAKALREADLSGTNVSAKGLASLAASKTLAKLRVAGCARLTPADLEKARALLPKVAIASE